MSKGISRGPQNRLSSARDLPSKPPRCRSGAGRYRDRVRPGVDRRAETGAAARRAHPAGCRRIFTDEKSGKDALRPELKACHASLEAGDTLVVPSLDRYGASPQDLINMVAELRERGIDFTSLHENPDTTTPAADSSSTSWPRSRDPFANSSSSAPRRASRRPRPWPGRRTPLRRHRGDHPGRP
ncbi:recombinase family protein [Streptomyces sp. NPDC014991]|uniref:recombinase family protein n=1 Tax=Streptomyces sp. NPDC014991 TaxID=3364935 RepID=UPI0036F5241A